MLANTLPVASAELSKMRGRALKVPQEIEAYRAMLRRFEKDPIVWASTSSSARQWMMKNDPDYLPFTLLLLKAGSTILMASFMIKAADTTIAFTSMIRHGLTNVCMATQGTARHFLRMERIATRARGVIPSRKTFSSGKTGRE